MAEHESSLAVLVDFENMARPGAKGRGDFDIHLVLDRLADKGRVLVKRAYADWSRYRDARHELMNAGLELIEMPSAREGAKNRADIKMAVDAMELVYSREHLDTFVLVSGDSDFTPLVGKLRELNKRVTGMGNRESTSELLIANCDEFIFYDSVAASAGGTAAGAARSLDPVALLRQTLTALQREGTEWPLASVVKDSMRRKNPAFNESDTGYSTFSKFLENAQSQDIVHLQTDPRSGTYRVELSGKDGGAPAPAAPSSRSGSGSGAAHAGDERGERSGDDDRGDRRRRRRPRRGESAEPKSEVFEIVIDSVADAAIADIPLDQPISYEDVILAGPDPSAGPSAGAAEPVLMEASDVEGTGPETGDDTSGSGRRRRRRRGSSAQDAEAVVGVEPASTEAAQDATLELETGTDAEETAEATAADAEESSTSGGRNRRRRRRTPVAEPEPVEADAAGMPVPTDAPEGELPVTEEAEEDAAPADTGATAEADAKDEATAPSGRSRVRRRRGASSDEAPASETGEAVADTAEAPAEDEAKPKRRTRRTKAQIEADKAAETGEATADTAEAPAEDEAKPKRRTRRTKAQIEADKAAETGEATADTAEAPAEDEAKPKRRTRRTKAQIEADKAADAPEAGEG